MRSRAARRGSYFPELGQPRWWCSVEGVAFGRDDEANGVRAALAHAQRSGAALLHDPAWLRTMTTDTLAKVSLVPAALPPSHSQQPSESKCKGSSEDAARVAESQPGWRGAVRPAGPATRRGRGGVANDRTPRCGDGGARAGCVPYSRPRPAPRSCAPRTVWQTARRCHFVRPRAPRCRESGKGSCSCQEGSELRGQICRVLEYAEHSWHSRQSFFSRGHSGNSFPNFEPDFRVNCPFCEWEKAQLRVSTLSAIWGGRELGHFR